MAKLKRIEFIDLLQWPISKILVKRFTNFFDQFKDGRFIYGTFKHIIIFHYI